MSTLYKQFLNQGIYHTSQPHEYEQWTNFDAFIRSREFMQVQYYFVMTRYDKTRNKKKNYLHTRNTEYIWHKL